MAIESIPESKIIFMNKEFIVVRETTDEIIDQILSFDALLASKSRKIVLQTTQE